jgi:hypothetical protein
MAEPRGSVVPLRTWTPSNAGEYAPKGATVGELFAKVLGLVWSAPTFREKTRLNARRTQELARRFTIRGRVAVVDTDGAAGKFDKTDLLLAGQEKAPVSIVRDSGMLTIAAPFDSGWDFVSMFALGGGMPTRVTIPEQKLDDVIAKINGAPEPTPR